MPPPRAPLPAPSRLRAVHLCVTAAVLTLLAGPTAIAQAQCEPPLRPHALICPSGGLIVRWFHPDLYADTISGSTRAYDHGFTVGGPGQPPKIAFRLSTGEGSSLIRSVSGYVVGSESVSEDQWSRNASLVWSLHADEDDRPGSPIGTEAVWDLGEDPGLRYGGWFQSDVDWLVALDSGSVWLVGSWPDSAAGIVALGADDGAAVLPTLAGLDYGNGITTWQRIWSPGILVTIASLSAVGGDTDSAGESLEFTVIAEVLDGPLSATADTAIVLSQNGLQYVDCLAAAGQVRRYDLQTHCDGSPGPSVPTESLAVAAHWPLTLIPESINEMVEPGWCVPPEIVLHNEGDTALTVLVDRSIELSGIDLAAEETSSGLSLLADADSLVIPAGQTSSILLTPVAPPPDPGTFTGAVRLRVGAAGSPWVDNRLIPIDLRVDAVTAVDQRDDGSLVEENHGLRVRPLTSPFGDQIRLSLAIDPIPDTRTMFPTATTSGGANQIEVIVYDILGRERARRAYAASSEEIREADGPVERELVISGTGSWSSGVYLCLVRWGPHVRAAKLLHLR